MQRQEPGYGIIPGRAQPFFPDETLGCYTRLGDQRTLGNDRYTKEQCDEHAITTPISC
jgi:hypothetical protein